MNTSGLKRQKAVLGEKPLPFLINKIVIFNKSFLSLYGAVEEISENKSLEEMYHLLDWISKWYFFTIENNWSLSLSNESDLLYKALQDLFMKSAT